MKSKSFDLKRSPVDKGKHNKTFDFISYYEPATENGNVVVNESGDGIDKENSFIKSQNGSPRQGSSHTKKKGKQEPLDISRINIEGPMMEPNLSNSPLNQSKITSTPCPSRKDKIQVKSIMKNSVNDDTMDGSEVYYSSKSKKRNKSVSFMLEENEDVVPKKTKSEESLETGKKKYKDQPKPLKLAKADIIKEKKAKKNKKLLIDNIKDGGNTTMETATLENTETNKNVDFVVNGDAEASSGNSENKKQDKKKNAKIFKNQKRFEVKTGTTSETNNNEETYENKKKVNKKKRKGKPTKPSDIEIDEPAAKSRKKEIKPELIAENLENLTIGDNPHTLSSMLDEMTVADKDRKKKIKRKQKKDKVITPSTEVENAEKVKWGKKWNKAKKVVVDIISTSVIVENLPLSLICSYKQVLAEHFKKYGVIKKIGAAEVYPSQCTGFTTTVQFEIDAAAKEALSEDGTIISGSSILVKESLPATETMLVVRSYAPLSDQSVSSTFSVHGRIRNIRRLVKGKKAIETVFIEFDGPEAVERAIELTKGAKVGGKKIHVAKFEARKKKVKSLKKTQKTKKPMESDGEADSENSSD